MARRNVEKILEDTYVSFRSLPKAQSDHYYVMNSKTKPNYSYLELGVRPTTHSPANRYRTFEEIVNMYSELGLENDVREGNATVSKVKNNIFRSRINVKTPYGLLKIWVPKLSWLFGNRIKVKYKHYPHSIYPIQGEGFQVRPFS